MFLCKPREIGLDPNSIFQAEPQQSTVVPQPQFTAAALPAATRSIWITFQPRQWLPGPVQFPILSCATQIQAVYSLLFAALSLLPALTIKITRFSTISQETLPSAQAYADMQDLARCQQLPGTLRESNPGRRLNRSSENNCSRRNRGCALEGLGGIETTNRASS